MALTTVKSDQIQTSVALAGSPTTTTQSASDNSTKIATTAYADTAVANLVASAPASLNTLDELAAALNDDANFASTITTSIAAKLPLAGGTLTGALTGTKVALSTGSTTDYVLRLEDAGVAAYDVTFPDTSTYQLTTNTTSDKTFKLLNSGSGTFNLNVEGSITSGTGTFSGGAANNNDDANILTLNASQHARLLVDTSSTGGHRATLALESNGNELTLSNTGSASYLTSVGNLEISGGNVGIGAASPGRLLEVKGTSNPAIRLNNNTDNADIGLASSAGALLTGASSGDLVIARNGSNGISMGTNGTTRLRVKSGGDIKILSGRLGIGMDAVQALDIDKTSGLSLRFYQSGTFRAGIQAVTGAGQMVGTSAANDFGIRSQSNILFASGGNTERMRIESGGNVGIGTNNPVAKLAIKGANDTNFEIQPDISSGVNRITNFNRVNSTYKKLRIDASEHEFYVSGNPKVNITSDGMLLKTAQSGFYAVKTSGQTLSINQAVIFNSATENIGSDYNTSTGVYTAPYSGFYVFAYTVLFSGIPNDFDFDHYLGTSNRNYIGGMPGRIRYLNSAATSWGDNYIALGHTQIAYMDANDTAYVYFSALRNSSNVNTTASVYANASNNWTKFSGYFLG